MGELLKLNYKTNIDKHKKVLLKDANVYGLYFYGDGTTVKRMPLINILASGAHLPTVVLEIVDCSGHMLDGQKRMQKLVKFAVKIPNSNVQFEFKFKINKSLNYRVG